MKKIVKEMTQTVTLEHLNKLVDELFALKNRCKIYTFTGDLGAGKTTLVKALLKKFGVHEAVTSPTFGYVNTYENDTKEKLHHFDLYRLTSLDEFFQFGFDEYLRGENSWAFIEWPAIIEPLLQHQVCEIYLEYDVDNLEQRIVTYKILE